MKTSNCSSRRRAARTDAAQRAQILANFDRSGLSAPDFARRHGLHYTTLYRWRRRDKSPLLPAFVEVQMPEPALELMIELGAAARLRLTSERQIPLATRLLQTLNASLPC